MSEPSGRNGKMSEASPEKSPSIEASGSIAISDDLTTVVASLTSAARATMAVAPSATSARTISRNDPASVIACLLMRVGATLLYEKQAYAETIHPQAHWASRILTTRTQ